MRTSFSQAIGLGALLVWSSHAAELDDTVARAARYSSGQDREPLRLLEIGVAQSITNQNLRAGLEEGLIRMLDRSASYEARKFACEQLAIIGSAEAVSALGPLLTDETNVSIASLALQTNPSTQADEVLRAAPAAGDALIQIVHTLGDRRDPMSVPALTQLARGGDRAVAEAAIVALGKIGDEAAQSVVVDLCITAEPPLSFTLAEAVLRIAERRVAEANLPAARGLYQELLGTGCPEAVRRGALSALLALDSDGGIRRILDLIKGSDTALQPTAIAAIDGLVGADVSRTFGLELANLKPELRALLIEALAGRGDGEAQSAIAHRIDDPDPGVRLAAIAALGRFGGGPSVAVIISAMTNADTREESVAAQNALVRLPPSSLADQAMIAALDTTPEGAKSSLITVLGQRRIRGAWSVLLTEAGNPAPAVGRASWQALGRLATAEDVPALLARMNELPATSAARAEAESAIARALPQIDADARSAMLRTALREAGNVESRCSILHLLPQAADAATLTILETAAGDGDQRVVDAAVRALAQWPDPNAWDALWRVSAGSASQAHRALALRALVRLAEQENPKPSPALIGRYRSLLQSAGQDADRKLVLGALGGVADPEALELAMAQLNQPGVRAEAELAVKRIAEAIKNEYPKEAQEALKRID
jgi:HEAT repeat protein